PGPREGAAPTPSPGRCGALAASDRHPSRRLGFRAVTQPSPLAHAPVVAHVVRSGFVESVHHGVVAATSPEGAVLLGRGDVDAAILPRSSNKPMQAVAMVRNGLDLDDELLALACASHSGEPFHLDGVRRM